MGIIKLIIKLTTQRAKKHTFNAQTTQNYDRGFNLYPNIICSNYFSEKSQSG
jgi:hypothetical protein